MANIHSSAIIGENVKIAEGASIGAYAIIEDGVVVGANSAVEPHARLCAGSIVGKNCTIGSFCTIAGLPQDLHFDKNIRSYVEIGDETIVREGSTIHRATKPEGSTKIGANCFLMANSHIGHDVVLGDRVIVAPFTALGGLASVGCDTFISGGVMIHQKVRVGCGAMVSGNAATSMDIPPYVNAFDRNNMAGLNLVGLMRRKTPRESIANLKELYHFIYTQGGSPRKNAEAAKAKGLAKTPEGEIFLSFFTEAPEGSRFLRPTGNSE